MVVLRATRREGRLRVLLNHFLGNSLGMLPKSGATNAIVKAPAPMA